MSGFFIILVVPDKASVHACDAESTLSTCGTAEPGRDPSATWDEGPGTAGSGGTDPPTCRAAPALARRIRPRTDRRL